MMNVLKAISFFSDFFSTMSTETCPVPADQVNNNQPKPSQKRKREEDEYGEDTYFSKLCQVLDVSKVKDLAKELKDEKRLDLVAHSVLEEILKFQSTHENLKKLKTKGFYTNSGIKLSIDNSIRKLQLLNPT